MKYLLGGVIHGLSDSLEVLAGACEGFFSKQEPPRVEGLTVLERRIQVLCKDFSLRLSAAEIAHIAATALAMDVPLVTNNPSDYAGVEGRTILSEAPP